MQPRKEPDAASRRAEAREWAERYADNVLSWEENGGPLDEGAELILALLDELEHEEPEA